MGQSRADQCFPAGHSAPAPAPGPEWQGGSLHYFKYFVLLFHLKNCCSCHRAREGCSMKSHLFWYGSLSEVSQLDGVRSMPDATESPRVRAVMVPVTITTSSHLLFKCVDERPCLSGDVSLPLQMCLCTAHGLVIPPLGASEVPSRNEFPPVSAPAAVFSKVQQHGERAPAGEAPSLPPLGGLRQGTAARNGNKQQT